MEIKRTNGLETKCKETQRKTPTKTDRWNKGRLVGSKKCGRNDSGEWRPVIVAATGLKGL